jgi:transcriptional regulator with XRE-family HTH domain
MPRTHDYRFLEEVGRRLQNRREELDMSQPAVAEKAQITPQQLSRYELGLSDPPISTLKRICHALDLNITALLVQTTIMEG